MSWPYEFKSGVTLFNKEKTYPGYIIYVTVPGRAGAEPYEFTPIYVCDGESNK